MKTAVAKSILLAVLLAGWQTAAAIVWTGASGDHDWNNPDNWDEGRVPGNSDGVLVPSGTPSCEVPPATEVQVYSLVNYGTVTSNGSFYMQTSAEVYNYGTMSAGTDHGMDVQAGGDFTNQGTVYAGYVNVGCDNFWNQSSATVTASPGDMHTVTVNCAGNGVNDGSMFAGSCNTSSWAGSLGVSCGGDFTNNGVASAGDNHGQGDGGDFTVSCKDFSNYNHGQCCGGSSSNGKGGNATVAASGGAVNEGSVYGGRGNPCGETKVVAKNGISNEGSVGQSGSRQEPGDVLLAASMVYVLEHDTFSIVSRNLEVIADRMMLGTVGRGPKIVAQQDNRFYLTTGGTYVTMEELDTAGVLAGGGNYVFADSIQPPPMGYALAFDPDPIIVGIDTGRRSALAAGFSGADSAGASGTLNGRMVNLSTSARAIGYNVASSLGWLTPASGTTGQLDPFAQESLPVVYSIPLGARQGERDTITVILAIPPSYGETTAFFLACDKDSFPPGVEERSSGEVRTPNVGPTIVRGVLVLGAVDSRRNAAYRAELLDAAGRKVLALRPGANDGNRLAPGVYFVREVSGVEREASAVTKVVIGR